MDFREHNRLAWDIQVERGNRWTLPVRPQAIDAAKKGSWEIFLTPTKPVPRPWLREIAKKRVLCLASGGGQQAPILAAAGALVTVLDNSPKQLERDALLAQEHHLSIQTVLGDMADLRMFREGSFEMVVHPVSNCFVSDVQPVWNEAFRVLRPGGHLISGFSNPIVYIFDQQLAERTGKLEVRYRLPYSDSDRLTAEEMDNLRSAGVPVEFSHTLEEQIGGQITAGFVLTGMYEDYDRADENSPPNRYTPTYIATRSLRPERGS